jgi:hypothetical protein
LNAALGVVLSFGGVDETPRFHQADWSRGGGMAARGAPAPDRMRRVGVLMGYVDGPIAQGRLTLFRKTLDALGWTEGRNVQIDYRFAASARMRPYAAELLAGGPDVIFASTPPVLAALNGETHSVPLVFVNVADPVGANLVQSLAKPGRNMTGFTNFEFSIAGKWLELLKEIAPSLERIAVIMWPQHATNAALFRAAVPAAESMQPQLIESTVRNASEIERAVEAEWSPVPADKARWLRIAEKWLKIAARDRGELDLVLSCVPFLADLISVWAHNPRGRRVPPCRVIGRSPAETQCE